jgi:hypothetical protein
MFAAFISPQTMIYSRTKLKQYALVCRVKGERVRVAGEKEAAKPCGNLTLSSVGEESPNYLPP